MKIKMEDFVPELPGKRLSEDVDWLGVLDAFDPVTIDRKYPDECASAENRTGWRMNAIGR